MEIKEQPAGNSIGRNIQGMGTAVIGVGIILSFTVGIIAINMHNQLEYWEQYYNKTYVIITWLAFLLGPFLSILSGMLIQGFGRLVENSEPKRQPKPMPTEAFK